MPLVKPRPHRASRASSEPAEEKPPMLAENPAIRASSLPADLECSGNTDSLAQNSIAWGSWGSRKRHNSSSSSVSLSSPPPPPPHKEPRLGTLVAVVLRARHLPDRHVCSKQNVYTTISFCGEVLRTKVDIRGGQHPQWDEELRFGVWSEVAEAMAGHASPVSPDADHARLMKISIWEDKRGPDLLVGEGVLDVSQALRKGEFDEWIPLSREGSERGEIFLELTYFSAGLPQIHSRPFSAEFKGYVPPTNMSYIVAPTTSMIAVAPMIDPGTARQQHRASLPPPARTSADVRHAHTKSMAGPIPTQQPVVPTVPPALQPGRKTNHSHSKSAAGVMSNGQQIKARRNTLHMDGLPSFSGTSLAGTHVPSPIAEGMPGGLCESPLASPTETKPVESSAINEDVAPTQNSHHDLGGKIASLIHSVANKLHIHEHEDKPESDLSSGPPSPSSSSSESTEEEEPSFPGGF